MADNDSTPKSDVIVRDVNTSDDAVAEIRKEMAPSEVGASVPIDRMPLRPNFVMLANSGVTTAAFGGTHRCIRVVTVPTRGGGAVQCHCSKACVNVGTDRLCPDHDGAAFQPSQTPVAKGRVTNSASIKLSKSELQDCGITVDPSLTPSSPAPVAPESPAQVGKAVAPSAAISDETKVAVSFSLEELASKDIMAVFQNRVCDALDSLPCGNLKQMKQMAAIQDKITKMNRKTKLKTLRPKEGDQI